jgi:hypothetical protein
MSHDNAGTGESGQLCRLNADMAVVIPGARRAFSPEDSGPVDLYQVRAWHVAGFGLPTVRFRTRLVTSLT